MIVMYILFGVWLAIFMFASYHALDGNVCATWVTGVCLWMMAMFLVGMKVFG